MLFESVNVEKRGMSSNDRFRFVPERNPHSDKSARELEHAIVHSHAARIAHSRRDCEVKPTAKPTVQLAVRAQSVAGTSQENIPGSSPSSTSGEPRRVSVKSAGKGTVRGVLGTKSFLGSSQTETTEPPQSTSICRRRRESHESATLSRRRKTSQPSASDSRKNSLTYRISIRDEGFLGLRVDPFRTVNPNMDDRAAFIIDWYNHSLSPSSDVVCYVFDVTNCYAHFLATLADDAFFHAGLCVLGFMFEQLRNPGSAPSPEVLRHRGTAMTKIRQRLMTNPQTDLVENLTVYSIIFLCVLECTMGNLEAHAVHKRSLSAIVAGKGGVDKIPNGSLLKSCLLQFDTFWTMETGESVASRRIQSVTSAGGSPCPARLADLPASLQGLYWVSDLADSGLESLCRAYELTQLNTRERSALISSTRLSPRRYNDFREANPYLDSSVSASSELGLLLSLTLVVYCYTAFGLRSCPSPVRIARTELRKRIPNYSPKSRLEEDAIIWMWLLTVNAWATDDALQCTGESLLSELQNQHPKTLSFSYVTELSKDFLWTPELTKTMERYWRPCVVQPLG